MAAKPHVSSLTSEAQRIARGNKALGIIVAICMIVFGILFMLRPVVTEVVAMVFATIGFIIYGIYQIIVYIRTPHDYKNGWTLANGIIFTILGFLILAEGPGDMFMTFAFLLGFLALYEGIMQCAVYSTLHKAGEPGAGWVLASGIINIVLSCFLIIWPFVSTTALAMVCGIYLTVGGVALFAEACSGHYGMKA